MSLVTGNVSTFGLTSVPMAGAMIVFTPSEPAVTGERYVLSAREVSVPIEIGTGAFTVDLAATEAVRPAMFYRIKIVSLDPANNYTYLDTPDWELRVPLGGGQIATLLTLSANPAMAWEGDEPPAVPLVPGVWWLDTDAQSDNFGWLMEWE